jgi:hypothetical protein
MTSEPAPWQQDLLEQRSVRPFKVTTATRYVAVAAPGEITNREWKSKHPFRALPKPVVEDYALMKVLWPLRQRQIGERIHIHTVQHNEPATPLDFSGLRDSDVIFIVGHGNAKGIYPMGPDADLAMERLVNILTGDGNLKKLRQGKKVIILLLSCRAGLGFHKALALELTKKLSIDVTVGGANGFTFGSISTMVTAHNEVLIRGIPWLMEYPTEISISDAQKETSEREGKSITVVGKFSEIQRFRTEKTKFEKRLADVVKQLRNVEVNTALDELDRRFRSQWLSLLRAQSHFYLNAKKESDLEFDMWFHFIDDGYVWTDVQKVTQAEVDIILAGDQQPVGDGYTSTR